MKQIVFRVFDHIVNIRFYRLVNMRLELISSFSFMNSHNWIIKIHISITNFINLMTFLTSIYIHRSDQRKFHVNR